MSDSIKLVNNAEKARQQELENQVKRPQRTGKAQFRVPQSLNPELAQENDDEAFKKFLAEQEGQQAEQKQEDLAKAKEDFIAQRQAQRAELESQERDKFLAALNKAYQGDLDQAVLENTTLVDYLSINYIPEANWEQQPDGAPIHFVNRHTRAPIEISKEEVVFAGKPENFVFEDALAMVQFAMLDKDFQEEGFTVEGANPQQQALIQEAVEFLSHSIPENQRIEMHNPALKDGRNPFNKPVKKAHKAADAFKNSPNTPDGFAPAISTEDAQAAIDDAVKELSDEETPAEETPANGLTEEVQASLKEQLAADFGDSADKGVRARTVSRDKIAGYLTNAGIKTAKGNPRVDVAAAFLEKENLVEAKTNGKRTTYVQVCT